MDITIEVMLPPRGAVNFAATANLKWRMLMPVAVYIPRKEVDVVGMQNTGYIHVTDVPMRPGWAALTTEEISRRMNARLCVGHVYNGIIEHSHWQGNPLAIPAAIRTTLREDRQITVTWNQFKNAIENFTEGNRALSDEDFE